MSNNPLRSDFAVPYPSTAGLRLVVRVNGCQAVLRRAAGGEDWVTVVSHYKRPPEPTVQQVGGEVTIQQAHHRSDLTNLFRVGNDSPVLTMEVNQQEGFSLDLENIGDLSDLALGGLPLQDLTLTQKLGAMSLTCAEPNPSTLETFQLEAQATKCEGTGLANLNFRHMRIIGIGASYKLGFQGQLRQDAMLELQAKESPTSLSLPHEMAVIVRAADGLLDTENIEFSADENFVSHEGEYWSPAALDGGSPLLTILVTPLGPLAITSH
jgi:hypothetical protein